MSLPEHAGNGHKSATKSPKQLLITIVLAFLIPIVIVVLLYNLLSNLIVTNYGSNSLSEEAIAKRIQPVAGFKLVDADAPKVLKTGEQVYESTCSACHSSGVAGAPKFGDKDSWAPFIKQGYEDLLKNALHGIGAMPPRGGNASLADIEVARAVVYMTNHSGADFPEPQESGDGQSAEAAPAAAPAADAAPAPAADAAPAVAAAPAAADAAPAQDDAKKITSDNVVGEKLYKSVCITCHSTGIAGAPKFGDAAAWDPFVKTGLDTMLKNAISGVGAMPPRGGSQATDDELKAAIEYMLAANQ
ncbi:c-type cytochrome [Castellaniella sp.]|uniref:c-type cytochrome n=1 Tax=Castellaniella sp. TaxID=1955812 RepID=UPI002AFE5CCB|nr:c-type cytochrome [Castellaniella sp.]